MDTSGPGMLYLNCYITLNLVIIFIDLTLKFKIDAPIILIMEWQ